MSKRAFSHIRQQIMADPMNADMSTKGYEPVYTVGKRAKIVIIGQAPGIRAQETKKPWNDVSGTTLRSWLGITDEQFYNPDLVAILPMDFYYPGKGKHGDLPPRKGFAKKWHEPLLALMPQVQLCILIGAYAQKYYLGKLARKNLTETVRSFDTYLPAYFPLVHPSPLTLRWRAKNPWFEDQVVPALRKVVAQTLSI